MDIKLINPNVLAYMDAVKDCNERGKFRLSGDPGGKNLRVEKSKPLLARDISNYEVQFKNGNLRTELLIAMRDELLSEKIDLGDGRVKDLSADGRRIHRARRRPQGGARRAEQIDFRRFFRFWP